MRLVSLNAWGGKLMSPLAAWVPTVGADILCLQEVTRAPVASPPELEYREGAKRLNQRTDLFGEVARMLPGHRSLFSAATRGQLYDENERTYLSEHGIACYIAPHLSIPEQVQRFVHGQFRGDGWGEPPVPRAIHVLRLNDPETDKEVVVAHLHGLREMSGKGDTPARAAQAQAIIDCIAMIRRAGDATILCGDLNLLPDSATFNDLAQIGLTDLVTARGHTDTRTSHYAKPERYANYMLVSTEVIVRSFDVPALPEVSDHRPMILDFNL